MWLDRFFVIPNAKSMNPVNILISTYSIKRFAKQVFHGLVMRLPSNL